MLIPYFTFASTCVFPFLPLLVVSKITPLAALEPYRAVAVASFNTVVDSMSEGSIPLKSEPKGIPSTTYSGARLEFTEPKPRILMLAFEPGCPLVEITCTPATSPVSALDNSDGFLLAIRSPLISVAEPVKDLFVAVP